jgi:hypothetical protein
MIDFFRYFNFEVCVMSMLNIQIKNKKRITRLDIKISKKIDQQNTDNVLPLKFDYILVH